MNPNEQVGQILGYATEMFGFDSRRDTLVVGVSGGPDSLALLHLLRGYLSPEHLVVGHLDHGLRPTSADEAESVARAAAGTRFFSERVDVAELARNRKLTIEEAGRTARYEFLGRLAEKAQARAIAVGHNADDQVETILMHLLRGSGSTGLRGMLPISLLSGKPGLWLLRPLLRSTRASIMQYCLDHDLSPIFDESNADTAYFRNRIRHDLLPILETYSPEFRRRILELSDIITADEELLAEATTRCALEITLERDDGIITYDLHAWRALPLGLRRRLLRMAVAEILPSVKDVGFPAIEAYRQVAENAGTGAQADLAGGGKMLVNYGRLTLSATPVAANDNFPQIPDSGSRPLSIPGEVDLGNGWRITAECLDSPDISAIRGNQDPWKAYVYCEPGTILHVRPRQKGERFFPLGMDSEVKIKEIMINRKIPRHLRDRWPIVSSDEHGLWIVGHATDHRARVLPHHRSAVVLRCLSPGRTGAS